MRIVFSIFTALLVAVLAGSTLALTMTAYTSSLSGRQSTQKDAASFAMSAQSSGDLAGTLSIKASLNPDGTVSGGSWELNVVDLTSGNETGSLTGTLSGGAVVKDAEDWASSANLQVNINSGTGSYAAVTSGSGAIQGTVDRESRTPFTGTLNLNF